jgi:hypothetical protein
VCWSQGWEPAECIVNQQVSLSPDLLSIELRVLDLRSCKTHARGILVALTESTVEPERKIHIARDQASFLITCLVIPQVGTDANRRT